MALKREMIPVYADDAEWLDHICRACDNMDIEEFMSDLLHNFAMDQAKLCKDFNFFKYQRLEEGYDDEE